jgi:hypothetical protein
VRLAALGGKSIRDVETGMDSAELSEWIAFDNVYGIPDGYFVAGQVCALMEALVTGKGHPADHVPYFRPTGRKRSGAEMKNILERKMNRV